MPVEKKLGWIRWLIVGLVGLPALVVVLIFGMTVFSWYGADHRVSKPNEQRNCEPYGTDWLQNLKGTVDRGDSECFVHVLRKSNFSSNRGQQAEISAYLAKQLSDRQVAPPLFQDPYVRLEALNIIVPDALGGDVSFDVATAHTYIRQQVDSRNSEIRKQALVVLSYYRDDADVEIFRNHALAQSDAEVFYSVRALAEHCSPKARGALRFVLSQERVKIYLRKYHDKETLTSLIAQRCPLNKTAGVSE